MRLILFLVVINFIHKTQQTDLSDRVVHAVNCGGEEEIGAYGIHYKADPNKIGTASDYGNRHLFFNVDAADRILYSTERYAPVDFSYSFDLDDGHYTAILKFSEVYFSEPNKKIFDVVFNNIVVLPMLDIISETGLVGLGLDKHVEFSVKDGILRIKDQVDVFNDKLTITFRKKDWDNPKINAIAIIRGPSRGLISPKMLTRDQLRALIKHPQVFEEMEEIEVFHEKAAAKAKLYEHQPPIKVPVSGPPVHNPYKDSDGNWFIIFVCVILILFPLVYLLQKL